MKGIADGISNSNWLLHTGSGLYILTVYEERTRAEDLPFFLSLLDHLAERDCPVPATIHDRTGVALRTLRGKPAALIEYLPGVSPTVPSTAQAFAAGAALAGMHEGAQDFPGAREPDWPAERMLAIVDASGSADLATKARAVCKQSAPALPYGIIHSDLFPDNVLMDGERVTGIIDFYFAHSGEFAYDLAVAHAAWSFKSDGAHYDPAIGSALIEGYESRRTLDRNERAAFPLLAQRACLRFYASRLEEWTTLPEHQRKDPGAFERRWDFYETQGHALFA